MNPCNECIVLAMCQAACDNLMDYWCKKIAEEFKGKIKCEIIDCIPIGVNP